MNQFIEDDIEQFLGQVHQFCIGGMWCRGFCIDLMSFKNDYYRQGLACNGWGMDSS